jgi:hypothetical protein
MLTTTTAADDSKRVDTGRGSHNTLLNNEWSKRPADQRFPDLSAFRTCKRAG